MKKTPETVIFVLDNAKELGASLKREFTKLKTKIQWGKISRENFSNGETLLKAETSVRGKNVYVVQSTSTPVNDSIMELLIFIDALKRASAEEINIVVPFFAYARQDRKAAGRQPITAKLIADMLTVAGATRVTTFDFHSPQIQGFFNIPVDDLKAIFRISDEIKKVIKQKKDLVVVSPDNGGIKRARTLANLLGANLAILDKTRTSTNNVKTHTTVLGDVKGKACIVIDDMIDTGGTISKSSTLLRAKGAKSVSVACTHGIFSGNAIKNLNAAKFDHVFVTNTISEKEKRKKINNLKEVCVSKFLAKVIESTILHQPISNIYNKK